MFLLIKLTSLVSLSFTASLCFDCCLVPRCLFKMWVNYAIRRVTDKTTRWVGDGGVAKTSIIGHWNVREDGHNSHSRLSYVIICQIHTLSSGSVGPCPHPLTSRRHTVTAKPSKTTHPKHPNHPNQPLIILVSAGNQSTAGSLWQSKYSIDIDRIDRKRSIKT